MAEDWILPADVSELSGRLWPISEEEARELMIAAGYTDIPPIRDPAHLWDDFEDAVPWAPPAPPAPPALPAPPPAHPVHPSPAAIDDDVGMSIDDDVPEDAEPHISEHMDLDMTDHEATMVNNLTSDWQPPSLRGVKLIHIYDIATSIGLVDESRPGANKRGEFEIDWIGAVGIKHKPRSRDGVVMVCVKWQGWPVSEATWEPVAGIPESMLPETVEEMRQRTATPVHGVDAVSSGNRADEREEEEGEEAEAAVEARVPTKRRGAADSQARPAKRRSTRRK